MPYSSKSKIIQRICTTADITHDSAEKAYQALLDYICQRLKCNETVYIPDFGRFAVAKRSARLARLPNGELIKVKSKKVATFRAYKHLKDAVN